MHPEKESIKPSIHKVSEGTAIACKTVKSVRSD